MAIDNKPLIRRLGVRAFQAFFPNHWLNFFRLSFSQNGEDILLCEFFRNQTAGFYVDIGAHHPIRFSNTYQLYRKGWKGLNIDALPGTEKLFRAKRNRDITLEIGVASKLGELEYWMFREPAFNTFDPVLGQKRQSDGHSELVEKLRIPVRPLAEILHKYLGQKASIDLLTIDVEGLDLEVLKSNDWDVFRPKLVCVELLEVGYRTTGSDAVESFLVSKGYRLWSLLDKSAFFLRV